MRYRYGAFSLALLAVSAFAVAAVLAQPAGHPERDRSKEVKVPAVINPPPTAKDWADIAKLPDWSGVWNPKITDQDQQVRTNPPPWNEKAGKLAAWQAAEEKAGRPPLIMRQCKPSTLLRASRRTRRLCA